MHLVVMEMFQRCTTSTTGNCRSSVGIYVARKVRRLSEESIYKRVSVVHGISQNMFWAVTDIGVIVGGTLRYGTDGYQANLRGCY